MNKSANRREQLRRQQEAEAKRKRANRVVGIGALVLALVLVGVFVGVLLQSQGSKPTAVVPPNANADATAIVVNHGGTPAAGAPVVTLYLDYQCPNCKTFETLHGPWLTEASATGEIVLQNKTMIFMDQNLRNTASSRAAIAAACSDVAGVYPAYDAAVFAAQPEQELVGSEGFPEVLLRETIPAQVGLTGEPLTQFQQCVDAGATQGFVEGVDKSAYNDGVTGTPSLAVNGTVLTLTNELWGNPEALRQAVLAG